MTGSISFRPLEKSDIALMHRWLHEPHVRRWYHDYDGTEPTLEYLEREYNENPAADGTRFFIILLDEQPVGYVQTYLLKDNPEYQAVVQEDGAGLDLFIGEPGLIHKGLGTQVIKTFVADLIFADPSIDACIIGPEVGNAAAIRAYEKAGFVPVRTVNVPGEPEPELIMKLTRAP